MSYASTSFQYGLLTQSLLKRVISLLSTTMSYAITYDQHVPNTQFSINRMIALLPSTLSYASTSDQHGLYTLTHVAMYDGTTTFYYVIC